MKYCKCGQCKAARRTKIVSKEILLEVRKARRKARQSLRAGLDPAKVISLPRYG